MKTAVLAFLLSPLIAFGATINSDLLIGDWIGTGVNSNQSLVIDENLEGTWIIQFDKSNISKRTIKTNQIEDMFVLYARIDGELVEKIVLSGWQHESSEALFGTRYLYHEITGNKEIFNGIPVSFQRTETHKESRLLRFLSEPVEERVSKKEFSKFLNEFTKAPGLESSDLGPITIYDSPFTGSIAVTKPGHPAFPAMLAITAMPSLIDCQPEIDSIILIGRYAGSRKAFLAWRSEFGLNLRTEMEAIAPFKKYDQ